MGRATKKQGPFIGEVIKYNIKLHQLPLFYTFLLMHLLGAKLYSECPTDFQRQSALGPQLSPTLFHISCDVT